MVGDEVVLDQAMLRELREIGGRLVFYLLNRRYLDFLLNMGQRIWGKVVRLRKNL